MLVARRLLSLPFWIITLLVAVGYVSDNGDHPNTCSKTAEEDVVFQTSLLRKKMPVAY